VKTHKFLRPAMNSDWKLASLTSLENTDFCNQTVNLQSSGTHRLALNPLLRDPSGL